MQREVVQIKKLQDLNQLEKIEYDDYFKVVYVSKVDVDGAIFKFKFTEEDGQGVKLEIFNNNNFEEVDFSSKFEWHFIVAMLTQGYTSDLSSMPIGVPTAFSYDKEAYQTAQILEL